MRREETEYGCFRCGAYRPAGTVDTLTNKQVCEECGEEGIVTFQQALDMLNEYWVRNHKEVIDLMDADEYYPEIAGDV